MISRYFSFNKVSVTLVLMTRVYFICSPVRSRLWSHNLRFLFFLFFLPSSKNSAILVWARADAFSLDNFVSLGLDFLSPGCFIVNLWVYTFESLLLEERWSLKQQISKFRTIIQDCRPFLTFALTVFYIISLKFTDFWFCYSISILIKGLRSY